MSEDNRSPRSHKKVTSDRVVSVRGREDVKSKKYIRPVDRLSEYDEQLRWERKPLIIEDRIAGEPYINLSRNDLIQSDAVPLDDNINELDRSILSLYLHANDIEECDSSRIISQHYIDDLDSILINYPFWDELKHAEQVQLKMSYLDYYISSLKLNAYIRYSKYMENLDDPEFQEEFDRRKIETKYEMDHNESNIAQLINRYKKDYSETTINPDKEMLVHSLILQKSNNATNRRFET